MTEDDQVDASQLEVDAENGIVTLHGTVPDREYKKQAEQVAEPVSGVRDVRNQLEIKGAMVDDLSDQARRSSSPGRQGMDELGAFRVPSGRGRTCAASRSRHATARSARSTRARRPAPTI